VPDAPGRARAQSGRGAADDARGGGARGCS
jgi:hypothetical protein